jgi:hypothetical protein
MLYIGVKEMCKIATPNPVHRTSDENSIDMHYTMERSRADGRVRKKHKKQFWI